MKTKSVPLSFDEAVQHMDTMLHLPGNFGYIKREIRICGMAAVVYLAEGLHDSEAAARVIEACMYTDTVPQSAEDFAKAHLPYGEEETTTDPKTAFLGCATGCLLLLCAAYPGTFFLVKCRNIPMRPLNEPEHDKVLRGNHVGFGETLPRNCALLRRQLPNPSLVMKSIRIGTFSETAVVMSYMQGVADMRYVLAIEKRLSEISCEALSLGMQSLAECLIKVRVWNPFPRFRYTERPDAAAASLCEGSILIMCDNSPQAMVLPVSIFSFLQETNDFYMPPFTGTYLRLVRFGTFLLSIYLLPIWYALVFHTRALPPWLDFIRFSEPATVPVLFQLLLIELAIDGLKIASMNTPNALANSLSVIGGLILGEFAVNVGWFQPECILYMSVVGIAHFAQNNYELGYALKYVRVAMLIFVALLGWWGVLLGSALFVFLLATTPTINGTRSYFYPLIPFDGRALFSLFFRRRKQKPSGS